MSNLDLALSHYVLWVSTVLGGITAGTVAIIAILQLLQDCPSAKKSYSNCLIFAMWRTISRGGVLILQRSHAGPYLHAMWAERLPSALDVEHFRPLDKSSGMHLAPLFAGYVAREVGQSHSPPPVEGIGWSPVFAAFWCINLMGWAALLALPFILL